ncbi:MAG: sulfatase-like hydrolase/transferase [Clostridia bacterium]|nr:sulfatase-like hydrolase/transferase [Clostridia bacterium]MBP5270784.1 sulfatase-like hydrolase/transferase [Clostridia bacterium]
MKNILFLFTDQLRYDAIGANGNRFVQTPNLDALAADSVVFDYCLTPSPVCVPARLSLLSGRYPARTGCNANNKQTCYSGDGLYGALTAAGLHSCNVGKMHNSRDLYGKMGFDERFTQEEMSNPADDYTKFILSSPYKNVFDYNGVRSEMYYVPQVSQLPAEVHPTQWVGDRSIDFINSLKKDEPFFLFSSFIHPHPPFCPPAPWNKLYRRESIPAPFVPENYREFKPMMTPSFDCEHLGITELAAKRLKNYYYACVSFVDYQVGRIISALKEKGLYEDTVIVFSSDHGEFLGDYSNFGKRSMLEPAVHVPLMMKIPGAAPCRRNDLCSLVDVAPTLLSLEGIGYGDGEFDGIDLFGGAHDFVYSQYSHKGDGSYMIASRDDKLVYSASEKKYRYFKTRPETEDLYDESDPRVALMKKKLDAYYESDVGRIPQKKKKNAKIKEFGTGWMDHTARHGEEKARIPFPYVIDLPDLPAEEDLRDNK